MTARLSTKSIATRKRAPRVGGATTNINLDGGASSAVDSVTVTGTSAADTIAVDGFIAGFVTADAVGQARLNLETPDDSNPLPPEFQPIEDLRMVEWIDPNGDVVLIGFFTGVSNDHEGEDESEDESDDSGNDDESEDESEDSGNDEASEDGGEN